MRRTATVTTTALAALALVAGPLSAATYEVELLGEVALDSGGLAHWDPYNSITPCATAADAFSPVEDGSYLGSGDAFDGAFVVQVAGTPFRDPDGKATLSGDALRTGGSALVNGIDVSATMRAVQSRSTLQYLVKLHNGGAKIGATVSVVTELGSDTSTTLVADSNGSGTQTATDRWLVTADAAAPPFEDPITTQVIKGRNASVPMLLPDAVAAGDDCMKVDFEVTIPGGGTRYLLLFAEMHDNSKAGRSAAILQAATYDRQSSMDRVLAGIPKRIYPKIVNWNLKR